MDTTTRSEKRKNTIKKHRSNLREALEFIDRNPMEITMDDIENREYEMSEVRGYKKATIGAQYEQE